MRRPRMLRASLPAFVTAAYIASHGSVSAQATIPDDASLSPEQTAQITMSRFADCLNRRSHRSAVAVTLTPPGSLEQRKAVLTAIQGYCLDGGELRFQPSLLRGAIFEQLFRDDYGKLSVAGITTKPAVDYSRGVTPVEVDARAYVALLNLADCATRKSPELARLLVLSPVAGTAEDRAFARLTPMMGGCMSQGYSVRFSKPMLRGAVAEALYSLSKIPSVDAQTIPETAREMAKVNH